MTKTEFSNFISKKLAPIRDKSSYMNASFDYFMKSGTANASFLDLMEDICTEYASKILNENKSGEKLLDEKIDNE